MDRVADHELTTFCHDATILIPVHGSIDSDCAKAFGGAESLQLWLS